MSYLLPGKGNNFRSLYKRLGDSSLSRDITKRRYQNTMEEPNEFEPDDLDDEDEELSEDEMRARIEREAEEIQADEDSFEDELPEQEPGVVSGPEDEETQDDDPVEDLLR